VLDLRVYRTAFLPALVALLVAAFSLLDRPAPAQAPFSADAFDGRRAFGVGATPEPGSLRALARRFPDRRAGSAGDVGLANRVAGLLGARDPDTRRPAFAVERLSTPGRTADGRGELVTVVGTRPGLSNRRIVVLAHRDAVDRPGRAALSGTAALLELARVFRARDLRKTLVLVSTSGATTGFSGARAWARGAAASGGGPVDAVLVLGDVAGADVRKPWVVPWSADGGAAPLRLQRTVEDAVALEANQPPGGARASGQWARRALPVTVSGQGVLGAAGLPAVLLSQTGERGPRAGEPVRASRLQTWGRATLRAVSALDAAGPGDDAAPPLGSGPDGIVTLRNVLPDWAVRSVVATLLLPALLAALDGFFRARRRRLPVGRWLAWLGVAAVPLLAAWLWLRVLGLVGLLGAPDAPVLPAAFPFGAAQAVALVSAVLAAGLAWHAARRVAARRRPPAGSAAAGGLAAATGLTICGLAAVTWVPNPYLAAILVPAAHAWLLAAAPERRPPRALLVAAVGVGLVLPLALVAHLCVALGLAPPRALWTAALAAAGGSGFWSTAVLAVLSAALVGLLRVLTARRQAATSTRGPGGRPPIRTRGPLTYAGPGSLGGTESALRR
jgi:Peptidase family M28